MGYLLKTLAAGKKQAIHPSSRPCPVGEGQEGNPDPFKGCLNPCALMAPQGCPGPLALNILVLYSWGSAAQ